MVEHNPFSWQTAHNPYPVYWRLRDEAPVYHNPFIRRTAAGGCRASRSP